MQNISINKNTDTKGEKLLNNVYLVKNIDTVELTAVNVRKIIEELIYLASAGENVNNNSSEYQDGLPTALYNNVHVDQYNSKFWVLDCLNYVYRRMSSVIHNAKKIRFKNEQEVRKNLKIIFGNLKHYSRRNVPKNKINTDCFYDYEVIGTDVLLNEREKLIMILKSTKDFKKNHNKYDYDTLTFQKIDKLTIHSEKWVRNRKALIKINKKIHKGY